MSREHKFKAWDEQSKTMHIPMTLKQIKQVLAAGAVGETGTAGAIFCITFNDLVFLEFTGLKDRNGKEIYEGDVFNCKRDKRHKDGGYIAGTYDYHPENAKVVEWRDGAFYVGHELLYAFWSFIRVPGHGQDLIGNVYQNPEMVLK